MWIVWLSACNLKASLLANYSGPVLLLLFQTVAVVKLTLEKLANQKACFANHCLAPCFVVIYWMLVSHLKRLHLVCRHFLKMFLKMLILSCLWGLVLNKLQIKKKNFFHSLKTILDKYQFIFPCRWRKS